MINIIGGKFKKTKIIVPAKEVRPTSAIKREAIFSILESYASNNSFEAFFAMLSGCHIPSSLFASKRIPTKIVSPSLATI